jgi:rhodanese-related sulfurtransferase
MVRSVDGLVEQARQRIGRVTPDELAGFMERGGLVVDIRPLAQREDEGALEGAVVVERNVLEWRLDPGGEHHLDGVASYDLPIVVVCSQGYASSLAGATLVELGHTQVYDLIGGYQGWVEWRGEQWVLWLTELVK